MLTVRFKEKQLNNLIKESIKKVLKEERSADIDDKIINLISYLHNSQKNIREIHWNTNEFALHMVTDETISHLFGWEDSLAETFISGRDIELTINDTKPSSNEFKTIMNELCDMCSEIKKEISDNKDYDNICAVVDEILEVSNQLLYKNNLK